jgi:hypothetical protein
MATDTTDVYALPRIIITSRVTITNLKKYLQGVGLRKDGTWRTVLRKTWRVLRRIKGSPAHLGTRYD